MTTGQAIVVGIVLAIVGTAVAATGKQLLEDGISTALAEM